MELTTRGRYAVMAMAELASHAAARDVSRGQADSEATALPLSQIAERQKLSLAYLEQIFVPLRRAGLVESARGRSGGYRLARAADDIAIAAIMAAVEEQTRFTRCADADSGCTAASPCLTHHLWQALEDVTQSFFATVSLGDVVRGRPLRREARVAAEPIVASSPRSRIYLDYNATAPLLPAARSAMAHAADVAGNPSSVHAEGRAARGIIEQAREKVAALVGSKPSEIVFTSGATEANAWVMAQPWSTILVSGVEHESVLATAAASAATVVRLNVGRSGVVDISNIEAHGADLRPGSRVLVSVQAANNETGVCQPVAQIADVVRCAGMTMHTDAVQTVGRLPIDFRANSIDLLSVSAHKLGGPKGIGALVIRDGLDLVPFVRGGGQERRRRAGTENLAAIAGFGAAAEAAMGSLQVMQRVATLRDGFEAALRAMTPDAIIVGSDSERLPNTTSIAVRGLQAETLVIKLDLAGFAVSAGAACSSGKVGTSHVLQAMGLSADIAQGAIRISLGIETTEADIAAFITAWKQIVSQRALAA